MCGPDDRPPLLMCPGPFGRKDLCLGPATSWPRIGRFRPRLLNARRHRALPERWVTVHSGDMGYTIGPFAASARCPGRRVSPWTSVLSSLPGGWTGRRWRGCAGSSAFLARGFEPLTFAFGGKNSPFCVPRARRWQGSQKRGLVACGCSTPTRPTAPPALRRSDIDLQRRWSGAWAPIGAYPRFWCS